MPVQLEFNLEEKDPYDHIMNVWARNETSNQKKFRRLFAENSSMKKRLSLIEDALKELEQKKIYKIYEYDLFTYKERKIS